MQTRLFFHVASGGAELLSGEQFLTQRETRQGYLIARSKAYHRDK